MKKMVLGIILSLSVTFAIGISNVSASIKTTFGEFPDIPAQDTNYADSPYYILFKYKDDSALPMLFVGNKRACTYTSFYTNYKNGSSYLARVAFYSQAGGVDCYVRAYQMTSDHSSWWYTGSGASSGYVTGYGLGGLYLDSFDIATSLDYGYYNQSVIFSSGYNLVTTNIGLSYEYISDNKGIITADYRHYVDELVDFDSTLLDSSVCMLDYYISYVDFAGVEHNLCDVGTNSLLIPIEVYYNGTYTFYIKAYLDDSILDSATIEVDDLLSISNDYTRYDIINNDSSSDHQFGVFVSQFQYDTDYTIYISPNYMHTINAIYYLDVNGDMVYSQSNFSYNLASNGFYYFTFNNHDTNIKTIYFNVDVYRTESSTLFLLINSSLYVDIRDLSDDNNYDCTNLPGWSSSVNNVTRCNVIYNTSSGGSDISTSVNTKTIGDDVDDPFSLDGNRDNTDNFTITFRNMFLQFSKPFYVIGNVYTNFMQVIPIQMMYLIYLGFGLSILAIFIKIWL